MKFRKFKEESFIFLSTIRWVILSVIIGVIVGSATVLFLKLLDLSTEYVHQLNYYYLLIPLSMFLTVVIIMYLAPDAKGHGTEKVIEAVHVKFGKIKAMVVPVKLLTTIMTISVGGSVGKEGPCAQIGGGLASTFSDIFRLKDADRKKLVICGISAGFAAVFGTPISGAIFGIEVLFIGVLLYDVLMPSFIAGLISYHTATTLGTKYFHHEIFFAQNFNEVLFIKIIGAGIFFGLVSFLMVEVMRVGEKLTEKLKIWEPFKGVIGGGSIIILTLIFGTKYLGLGTDTIKNALDGVEIVWYAFLIKILITSITLNFGASGGIATPLFFIGATAGVAFARLFGLDISAYAAIGFVSVLSGATNTPIAASIMSIEMFGPGLAPYATVACVISFLMTGHRSVYPSQILALKKTSFINVEMGKKLEELEDKFDFNDRRYKVYLARLMKRVSPLVSRKEQKKKSKSKKEEHRKKHDN